MKNYQEKRQATKPLSGSDIRIATTNLYGGRNRFSGASRNRQRRRNYRNRGKQSIIDVNQTGKD